MALVAGLSIAGFPDRPLGDWEEYFLTEQAFISHGSPDIRYEDFEELRQKLKPAYLDMLRPAVGEGLRTGIKEICGAFIKVDSGNVYAIHYFGYSFITAIVDKLTGLPVGKAFLAVNALFVMILAVAAHRLFRSIGMVCVSLLLFVACGGSNYLSWRSPEIVSAAGLLSALLLIHTGSIGGAAIMLGLAAMQNPTIILAFPIIPAFYYLAKWKGSIQDLPWSNSIGRTSTLLYVGTGILLALLPILFNLWAFGTPNIIAKLTAKPELIGLSRLHSFYLDLNQGMLPNLLGLSVGLFIALLQSQEPVKSGYLKFSHLLLLAATLSVAMAIPTLATPNWSSGAVGMMRYAFWSAMPFLFVLLIVLAEKPLMRIRIIVTFFLVAIFMRPLGYPSDNLKNTRLAQWIFAYAPSAYNPDPEIFAERLMHQDGVLDPAQVYVYRHDGQPTKILYHEDQKNLDALACGPNAKIAGLADPVRVLQGWMYQNGRGLNCQPYNDK